MVSKSLPSHAAEEALNLPELIIGGILLTLVFSSVLLWIVWGIQKLHPPLPLSERPLRPWAIGWVNFGIFICGLIGLIFLVQSVIWILCGLFPEPAKDEVWAMALRRSLCSLRS